MKRLKEYEGISDKEVKKIEKDVTQEIEDGINFALNSPELSADALLKWVYAEEGEE